MTDDMPEDAVLAEKVLYDDWDYNPNNNSEEFKQELLDLFGMESDPCPEEPLGIWKDMRDE